MAKYTEQKNFNREHNKIKLEYVRLRVLFAQDYEQNAYGKWNQLILPRNIDTGYG